MDPLRDAVSLDLELMLADLEQIERRLERLAKDLKKKKETILEFEQALLLRCQAAIQAETPLREMEFTPEERKVLTGFMFLSARPMLYVLNLGDDGGVACCLDIGGPEPATVHIVSITHLLFDRRSPLFRDIDTYQRRRIKKLKQQQGRGF